MAFQMVNGWLYCEELRVDDIRKQISLSPFYLYSADQIRANYWNYKTALQGIDSMIAYAVKANGNLRILEILRDLGVGVTLVSGNELRLALVAGFESDQMIFNGNGKTTSELRLAAEKGVYINIDSIFDLNHIFQVSQETGLQTKVFLRINPGLDPGVHPYIATGHQHSKFGLPIDQIPFVLEHILEMKSLSLVGLHCHLGSTIDDVNVFHQTMGIMVDQYKRIQEAGFPLQYINLGGGLGIDYWHNQDLYPTPVDLVDSIKDLIPSNATLILEPGRSLIGDAGILVCEVIGVKTNGEVNYIVVDGSMTELIRPCLYNSFHKIDYTEPTSGEPEVFNIVGPVCESTDFLGLNRSLARPDEGTGVAIFDTGAYGYAMSSNYNARNRPAEYLVDGAKLIQIRRAEIFKDQLNLYNRKKRPHGKTKDYN